MRRLIFLSVVLLIMPGVFTLRAQINEELNPEIFKNHRGEILFSNNPIDLNNLKDSDLKNEFNLQDEIYAQVILSKTLKQSFSDHDYTYDYSKDAYDYNYALQLYADGEKIARWLFELPKNYFNYALTIDEVLVSNDSKTKRDNSSFVNEWAYTISSLKEGKRKIKLTISPITKDLIDTEVPVIAEGSFTYIIQKDKVDDFIEMKTTDVPPVSMINQSVEEKILEASNGIYPYTTPIKAYITDIKGDWTYAVDDLGNISSRNIVASVVYLINTSKNCVVKTGYYTQKHEGYGNFGTMRHSKETQGYYDYQIPCNKVE